LKTPWGTKLRSRGKGRGDFPKFFIKGLKRAEHEILSILPPRFAIFQNRFSGKFARISMRNRTASRFITKQFEFEFSVFFSPRSRAELNEAISNEKFKYFNVWELMLF
jgi:hypothetical protein